MVFAAVFFDPAIANIANDATATSASTAQTNHGGDLGNQSSSAAAPHPPTANLPAAAPLLLFDPMRVLP